MVFQCGGARFKLVEGCIMDFNTKCSDKIGIHLGQICERICKTLGIGLRVLKEGSKRINKLLQFSGDILVDNKVCQQDLSL